MSRKKPSSRKEWNFISNFSTGRGNSPEGSWSRWILDLPGKPAHSRASVLNLFAILIVFSLLSYALLRSSTYQWESVWAYRISFWNGWLLTIGIASAALVCSTLLGLLAAASRRSAFLPLRALATVYIEVVRGSPFLVLILIGFYVVLESVGVTDRLLSGIILLSIFSGAYIAEIFRAGIESVGKSQLESARAIGLTRWQTYRFVVLPQALRQTMPPLAGQFASLIKDSSLLSIIGLSEFTLAAQQVTSATYSTLEALLPLVPGYLILTLPISYFSRQLEKRAHFDT